MTSTSETAAFAMLLDSAFGFMVRQPDSSPFPGMVSGGQKALKIAAEGNRRKVDVLVAMQYRHYKKFLSLRDQSYYEGICFLDASSTLIVNYPKYHSVNCTAKHQQTNGWFKPVVRIIKNMRNKLIADGVISADLAPSYFIECLLYNVPNENFGSSYRETFIKSMKWILEADRARFVCANGQFFLLRGDINVQWTSTKCDLFLNQLVELWNEW